MGPIYSLADVIDMVRRRFWVMALVVLLGCAAALNWAAGQVHLYRSSEVIQIEQPKIAGEMARSAIEGSSARRLQLIEQQLMARSSLQEMIDEFGLYQNLTGLTQSEKIDLLRRSVSITGVAAARQGFADDGTISVITITAEMETAKLAQGVAHAIADRTRELSAIQRQEQTAETLAFFEQQEANITREITDLESELANFRSANDLSLSGGVDFQLAEIASLNDAILEMDRAIITAQLARTQIDRSARSATVQRQETEIDAQLETLQGQRSLLIERRSGLRATINSSPETDRDLSRFNRRMEQLQNQLDVIATRRSEAEVGFSLETAARGERLTTIEEAPLPDYPITMSKKKRAIMGGVASVLLAFGVAFLLELRRPVIRTAAQMQRETGIMPVVSVPELAPESRQGRKARQARSLQGRDARAARRAALESHQNS
ncbi:MAG: GumC family protein [Sulfitobacter sp.]